MPGVSKSRSDPSYTSITTFEAIGLGEELALEKQKNSEAEEKYAIAQANILSLKIKHDLKLAHLKRVHSRKQFHRTKAMKLEKEKT